MIDWFRSETFIHIIGAIGIVFSFIAYQCKVHKNVMVYKTTNEMLFALQYFLLGAYTGVTMNVVGSVRNLLYAALNQSNMSKRRYNALLATLMIVFSIVFIVFGLFTWEGYITIVMILAKIITTFAYGIKNTRVLRFLTLPTSICWLIYNLSNHSLEGAFCEAFTILSLISAIIRIDIWESLMKKKA